MRMLLPLLLLLACTDEASRPTPPDCAARRAAHDKVAADVERLTVEARKAVGEEASTLAWTDVELARLEMYRARAALHGCP